MGELTEKRIDELANTLEGRIESGDCSSLSMELNSISGADRLAVARAMRKLNEQHRKERPELGLPHLVILELKLSGQGAVRSEYLSKEQLLDMTIEKSGKEFDLYDPIEEQKRPLIDRNRLDGVKLLEELLPSFVKGRESLAKGDLGQAKACYERAIGEADRITPAGFERFKQEIDQLSLQQKLTGLDEAETKNIERQKQCLISLAYSRQILRRELGTVERALGNEQKAQHLFNEANKLED